MNAPRNPHGFPEVEEDDVDWIMQRDEDGVSVDVAVARDEVALPWTISQHTIREMGFAIRDAHGRHRALVPNRTVAETIVAAVTAAHGPRANRSAETPEDGEEAHPLPSRP